VIASFQVSNTKPLGGSANTPRRRGALRLPRSRLRDRFLPPQLHFDV